MGTSRAGKTERQRQDARRTERTTDRERHNNNTHNTQREAQHTRTHDARCMDTQRTLVQERAKQERKRGAAMRALMGVSGLAISALSL